MYSHQKVPGGSIHSTETSVKKCVRAGSNFIAFIPSRSIRQMLANLSGVGF